MPELPEVELVKRELKTVERLTIEDVKVSDKVIDGHNAGKLTIVKEPVDIFIENAKNMDILSLGRRGKYLYFILQNDHQVKYLIGHLGMSGAFFHLNSLDEIVERNFKVHWHVIFYLSDGSMLVYSDIRRFGELRTIDKLSEFLPVVRMAPEYDTEEAEEHFLNAVKSPKNASKTIKAVLMDSTAVTGVGNIYAAESLYSAKILPTRKAGNISVKRLENLYQAIIDVFELSLSHGGSTISDYRSSTGGSGEMQNRFQVYQRKNCPAGHDITTKVIAGRNTFYCTKCQR